MQWQRRSETPCLGRSACADKCIGRFSSAICTRGKHRHTSVHISFTFSRIMLQCLSNALMRPSSFLLLRQLISTYRDGQERDPVQSRLSPCHWGSGTSDKQSM